MNQRSLKNYFNTSRNRQCSHKAILRKKLEEVEKYANRIGLEISEIILRKKDYNLTHNTTRKIDIVIKDANQEDELIAEKQKTLRSLIFKEKANISNHKYTKTKSILDFVDMPSFDKINKVKKKIDDLTELKLHNRLGIYVNALQKITLACTLYLTKRKKIQPDFNTDIFTIKIACDGTNITRSRVNLLNLSFTIIDDKERCKTAFGNFILGND